MFCGSKHGFARVRCPKCGEELFVPFSCRARCFCPSCHEKRALEKAGWVSEHVCAEVRHRQFVSCHAEASGEGGSRFPSACGSISGSIGGSWATCAGPRRER